MINIITISILMSIDLFVISILLNLKSIYIPIKSYFIMLITSSYVLFLSLLFSNFIKDIISDKFCFVISGMLFIMVGISQFKGKSINFNNAFRMGLFASIDSIAACISLGITGHNIFVCIFVSFICNFIALYLGSIIKIKKVNYIEIIVSFIFILIGVLKLIKSL